MLVLISLIHGETELKRMADNNWQQAQRQYKRGHDSKVRLEKAFAAVDYVFVEIQPVPTTASE